MKTKYLFFTLVLLALLALAGSVSAAATNGLAAPDAPKVFNVTKTADTNDGACTLADCSLREAMIAANANPGKDTINVPVGTYGLTIGGPGENAAATGDLDITDGVVIQGASKTGTIIHGNFSDRVFDVFPSGNEVLLASLTIRNGVADSAGGLRNAGTTTLSEVNVVVNRSTAKDGGGIGNDATGVLEITNQTYVLNNQAGESGGGIDNDGTVTISYSAIASNKATKDAGGIANDSTGKMTITNSVIWNNTAGDDSGGIKNDGILEIDNSNIGKNAANGGDAGGLRNTGGTLRLTRSSVFDNTTVKDGAGIDHDGGRVEVVDSSIHHNIAVEDGGGVDVDHGPSDHDPDVEIVNSTIAYNSAGENGGGFNSEADAAGLWLTNTTVAQNSAGGGGGGIWGHGVYLKNTILAENAASFAVNCGREDWGRYSQGYNVFGDLTGCAMRNKSNQLQVEPTDVLCQGLDPAVCPGLGAFINDAEPRGGQHFPLMRYSVAIDRADNGACSPLDQIGSPRTDGDGDDIIECDIGAIEYPPYYNGGENKLTLEDWFFRAQTPGVGGSIADDILAITVNNGPARACWHQDLDGAALQGKAIRYEAEMHKTAPMNSAGGFANPYISLQVQRGDGSWQYNYGGIGSSTATPGGPWVGRRIDVTLPADMAKLRASFCVYDATAGTAEARSLMLRLAVAPPPPPPPPLGQNLLSQHWTWVPGTVAITGVKEATALAINVAAAKANGCWVQDIPGAALRGATVRYEASMAKTGVLNRTAPKLFVNPYISLQAQTSDGIWHYNHGGVINSRSASGGPYVTESRDIVLPAELMTLRASFCVWQAQPGTGRGKDFFLRTVNPLLAQGEESMYPTWEEYMPDTPSAMDEDRTGMEMPEMPDLGGLLYLPLMQQ